MEQLVAQVSKVLQKRKLLALKGISSKGPRGGNAIEKLEEAIAIVQITRRI